MKKLLLVVALSATVCGFSQFITDFETPDFGVVDSAWFGQDQVTDGDTIYNNGLGTLELNYNAGWQSYSGFAVSSWTDVSTPGYGNQFSAITGSGANASSQYGVCFVSSFAKNRVFLQSSSNEFFESVRVTNTTYAYHAMLNGDMFSKPFGADTSAAGVVDGTNGEDWFLLTIYALGIDSLQTGDSINFYLADYTFAEDSLDYIVDTWELIDLSPLYAGPDVLGLDFVLSSSDTSGGFGMNTPAYFAMDDLIIQEAFGFDESSSNSLYAYPNPTIGQLTIETVPNSQLNLYDLNGRLVKSEMATTSNMNWNLTELDEGVYILKSNHKGELRQARIILQ